MTEHRPVIEKHVGHSLGTRNLKTRQEKKEEMKREVTLEKKLQENIDSMKGKNFLEQVQKLTLSGTWKRGLALTTPCLG